MHNQDAMRRIGYILRQERHKRGWTQDEMARESERLQAEIEKAGKTSNVKLVQATVQRYETAQNTHASLDVLARICHVLGITLVDVLNESGYLDTMFGEPRHIVADEDSLILAFINQHTDIRDMLRIVAEATLVRTP